MGQKLMKSGFKKIIKSVQIFIKTAGNSSKMDQNWSQRQQLVRLVNTVREFSSRESNPTLSFFGENDFVAERDNQNSSYTFFVFSEKTFFFFLSFLSSMYEYIYPLCLTLVRLNVVC
jgi:hypothetical protein